MSALIPFQFENKEIRVVTDENGEPLFVGKDICTALGYCNQTDAMNTHCKGVAKRYPLQTAGGMQEMRVLSEPDVLRLIVNCSLSSAQAFERLVFEEILPSIRKTGSYSAPASKTRSARTPDLALAAIRTAKAMQMNLASAAVICARFPQLGEQAQQTIFAKIVGIDMIPLPILESRTYTATDVGTKLNTTANAIGRLANAHNLKTTEFGIFVLDKSKSSDKQVESFRYNDAGVARLADLMGMQGGTA